MRRLEKFLRLESKEKSLLIKAVLLLGMTRIGLWLLPFQTVQRFLGRIAVDSRLSDNLSSERIVWIIKVASTCVPRATCLVQALAAQVLLAQYGYSSDLRFGVTRCDRNKLQAHAWLENKGKVIIGGARLDQYKLLR